MHESSQKIHADDEMWRARHGVPRRLANILDKILLITIGFKKITAEQALFYGVDMTSVLVWPCERDVNQRFGLYLSYMTFALYFWRFSSAGHGHTDQMIDDISW
jgi:hypothetical protein